MSNYQKILSQFRQLGFHQHSYLRKNQALRSIDAISYKNAGIREFDRSIAEQLWNHCQPNPTRGVKVNVFVNTIVEAQSILRQQMGITEAALRMQYRPRQIAQLQDQYNQIIMDHNTIALPFMLPQLRQAQQGETSRLLHTKTNNINDYDGDSVIFSYEPNFQQQSSRDLEVCFILSVIMTLIQLILMFDKHHFLTIFCIFGVLSIFFLNYFDKNYIKFLLILLLTSIIFDIAWLSFNVRQYWNPDPQSQHSTLHNGFLRFTFIAVIIMICLTIAIFGILFKYRENQENFKKNVSIFGFKIQLDGKPTYNPFFQILRAVSYQDL